MTKTHENIRYNANLKVNREYYETKLGHKLQAAQWKNLEKLMMEYKYINSEGLIKVDILDKVVKIKKLTGSKYIPNKQLFDTFFTWYYTLEEELKIKYKHGIMCAEVWNRSIEICKTHAKYEPGDSTVYGWFRKSNIKFDKYKIISLDVAQDIFTRAFFSNIKYSRKEGVKEVENTQVTLDVKVV